MAVENGVCMWSPSTLVKRSIVTVTCGLSSAKSLTNDSTSSSDRSMRVRAPALRGMSSRKKYGSW
jgi:hypothetical protein